MMKRQLAIIHLLLLFALIFLVACGTAPPAQLTREPIEDSAESNEGQVPQPDAVTAPPSPTDIPSEVYPPPVTAIPNRATLEPGYPPPPTFPPTVDPYPGGLVWIVRPVGVQCEDGTAPGYGDLSESVATLTAAGIQVEESEMMELMVTAVCGAPTSAHYRVSIQVDGLDTALSMGWEREQ